MPNITDKFIKSKQHGPRSDCSNRNSLIWIHTACHRVSAESTFVVIGTLSFNVFCYRRRQREYDYLPRNDSLRSRSHRSSSRRPLHRKESTSSQGGTLVPLDPECNDCNEIVQEIQVLNIVIPLLKHTTLSL